MKHLKSKISRVLVLYIILFSSVVTLFLTAIQLRIDYNDGINVIYQRIKQIEITNIDSITQALWTIDHSSVQIQLDGLSRINDIIFVSITDENNRVITKSGKIDTDKTITKQILLYQKYRGRDTLLGTLTIVATKENVYQKLIDTVIVILISQAIKTFLVSIFVLFIFYYLVTRHLEKIAAHSSQLNLISKPVLLALDRKNSSRFTNDELELVIDSINEMSNNIFESYNKLIDNQLKLATREANFSAIFDSISDAIVLADCQRKIVQINPAFYAQFGYGIDDLRDQTTQKLYAKPNEYFEQGKKRYNPDSQSSPTVYEIEYRRKDGTTFPSETMGGAITLPDGTKLGFIGIIRDVSARKQAEEEKLRLQKQLQQSQKMEAIGQLTGGIAHDFNNILASILGYAELSRSLVKTSDNRKLKQYIEHINSAGERARDLVAQMLAFGRSSPGAPEAINLPVLINEVTSLIRPTIPSSIKLLTEIDEHVPFVFIDNTQMHQVLVNLCINARDAIVGHGALTIKLSYETDMDAICNSCNELIQGEYVKLSVEDTGSGIEDKILDKIFDPFLTTKEVGKGTGMGLSVVHGILHKHDSHIIVETGINIGSRFQLLIPPIKENEIPEMGTAPSIKISKTEGRGKHILIVDDENSVAMFLQDLLETYSYQVTATTSSKHAIEVFKNSPHAFDLILTDQTMPEFSGTEMIEQIFQLNPDIPVILCSGYNEQISEKEALELGCSRYLGKPINTQLLIQTLQEILA